MKVLRLSALFLSATLVLSFGQSPIPASVGPGQLPATIARLDAKLFDAFNAHDLNTLMSMFTDDLEFYQDNDGLKNFAQSKDDFKKLFANVPDIRRELVKEGFEVYPIKDYGAIEIGSHRFCHEEKAGGDNPSRTDCGTFKFAMVWRKNGDAWKISRVISYGH